jgi:hypothetical protein
MASTGGNYARGHQRSLRPARRVIQPVLARSSATRLSGWLEFTAARTGASGRVALVPPAPGAGGHQ